MIEGKNKGITVTYNHLNLPEQVSFGGGKDIQFSYLADGSKLKKTVNDNGSIATTDYVNGMIYQDNALQYIPTAEGRAVPESNGSYRYEYHFKDHQGNLRMAFSDLNHDGVADSTEVLQENSYYPYGLEHYGTNSAQIGAKHKFTYSGKEFNDELGLNWYAYGWRDFEPALGRFNTQDRFSEKYYDLSPYQFAGNSPILLVDINGDSLDIAGNEQSKTDILSLAKEKNQQYIKIDNNQVQLDFGELAKEEITKLFSEDEGLSLLNDIINSQEKFLYEASDIGLVRDNLGNKAIKNLMFEEDPILNYSDNGCDSNGELGNLPKENYNGQVVISPSATFFEYNNKRTLVEKSRASIVFHELSESFERTHNGLSYHGKVGKFGKDGAHTKSAIREKKWHGASFHPGRANVKMKTISAEESYKKYGLIIREYMKD